MRKKLLQGCVGVLLVLAFWTLASVTGLFGRLDPDTAQMLFPLPARVGRELVDMLSSGYLLSNLWVSMKRVFTGFFIAAVIGLPVGILIGTSETACNMIYPILRFVSPIPGVAWVPLAILWFGLGNQAAIFIIVMGSLSPIIVNTYQGMQNVDRRLYHVLDIMEANWLQRIRYCVIPGILPYVMAGFRLGLGFAWRVVIAAEMVGVPKGMGYVLSVGRNTGNTASTLIVIISLGVVMILMEEVLFRIGEKQMNKWKTFE
ncbi:MAG: ABC transporter permease [Lachnospiraceae bacterium]|nr:ABC transporter permease [Lachnospiraceae bacterium]